MRLSCDPTNKSSSSSSDSGKAASSSLEVSCRCFRGRNSGRSSPSSLSFARAASHRPLSYLLLDGDCWYLWPVLEDLGEATLSSPLVSVALLSKSKTAKALSSSSPARRNEEGGALAFFDFFLFFEFVVVPLWIGLLGAAFFFDCERQENPKKCEKEDRRQTLARMSGLRCGVNLGRAFSPTRRPGSLHRRAGGPFRPLAYTTNQSL